MMAMRKTAYTARYLRSEAVRLVRQFGKLSGFRAKCTGYTIEVRNSETSPAVLVAYGQRAGAETLSFDVRVVL